MTEIRETFRGTGVEEEGYGVSPPQPDLEVWWSITSSPSRNQDGAQVENGFGAF